MWGDGTRQVTSLLWLMRDVSSLARFRVHARYQCTTEHDIDNLRLSHISSIKAWWMFDRLQTFRHMRERGSIELNESSISVECLSAAWHAVGSPRTAKSLSCSGSIVAEEP